MDIENIGDKAFWNQEEENAYWPRACPICADFARFKFVAFIFIIVANKEW